MHKGWALIWCICLCVWSPCLQGQTVAEDSFKNVLLNQSELNVEKENIEEKSEDEELAREAASENTNQEEEEETEEEPELMELRRISDEDWEKVLADSNFTYKPSPKKVLKQKAYRAPWLDGIGRFLNSGFFKFLLYFILAALVIFVVYSIFSNSELRLGSLFKPREKKATDYTMDNVAEFTDWDQALDKALQLGDYRKALRILYLKILHQMNDKSHIHLEPEKTNWDYVQETKARDYHTDFTMLTRYFDYVWYGEFAIDQNSFMQLREVANRLQQKVAEL